MTAFKDDFFISIVNSVFIVGHFISTWQNMPMLFHKTWNVILERSQSIYFNICILGVVLMLEKSPELG